MARPRTGPWRRPPESHVAGRESLCLEILTRRRKTNESSRARFWRGFPTWRGWRPGAEPGALGPARAKSSSTRRLRTGRGPAACPRVGAGGGPSATREAWRQPSPGRTETRPGTPAVGPDILRARHSPRSPEFQNREAPRLRENDCPVSPKQPPRDAGLPVGPVWGSLPLLRTVRPSRGTSGAPAPLGAEKKPLPLGTAHSTTTQARNEQTSQTTCHNHATRTG